jgi:elongation factor P hydroxylase
MNKDTRYPYTYACDYLRGFGGYDSGGVRLSRADASSIRTAVAAALGMSDEELAKKLADFYVTNEESLNEKSTRHLISAMNLRTTSEQA